MLTNVSLSDKGYTGEKVLHFQPIQLIGYTKKIAVKTKITASWVSDKTQGYLIPFPLSVVKPDIHLNIISSLLVLKKELF